MKGDVMVCDYCGSNITKVLNPPADGWPHLHAICPACHEKLIHKPA